jgi:hypothetical protein
MDAAFLAGGVRQRLLHPNKHLNIVRARFWRMKGTASFDLSRPILNGNKCGRERKKRVAVALPCPTFAPNQVFLNQFGPNIADSPLSHASIRSERAIRNRNGVLVFPLSSVRVLAQSNIDSGCMGPNPPSNPALDEPLRDYEVRA